MRHSRGCPVPSVSPWTYTSNSDLCQLFHMLLGPISPGIMLLGPISLRGALGLENGIESLCVPLLPRSSTSNSQTIPSPCPGPLLNCPELPLLSPYLLRWVILEALMHVQGFWPSVHVAPKHTVVILIFSTGQQQESNIMHTHTPSHHSIKATSFFL